MSGSTLSAAFGFHTQATAPQLGSLASYYYEVNVAKVMSYFPLLGIFPLVAGISEFKNGKTFHAVLIARGALSFTGLSMALVIPDLIVTINRHCFQPLTPTHQD